MKSLGTVRLFMGDEEIKGTGTVEWGEGTAEQQLQRAKRDTTPDSLAGVGGELSVTMKWQGRMKDPAMREHWFKLVVITGSRLPRGMQRKPTKKQHKDKRHGQKI